MKEISLGVLAALFFAVTFVLNHAMELDGGSWLWSSSLRYFFMVPFLVIILYIRGASKFTQLKSEMKSSPLSWFIWSFVGFVLFYAPLTFAAGYGPGWLISGTWQLTIVAGVLLAPLFFITLNGKKVKQQIPILSLFISLIILVGILFIQIPHASTVSKTAVLFSVAPVLLAAFAYPLGNRKMMALTDGRIDPFQRVLGMTIASLPVWLVFALIAYFTVGLPSINQVVQCLVVALSSGVIATTLFFIATDRVRSNQGKLAAVEATQSTEVLFALIGEIILLNIAFPTSIALVGIGIIIVGMLLHSAHTAFLNKRLTKNVYKKA